MHGCVWVCCAWVCVGVYMGVQPSCIHVAAPTPSFTNNHHQECVTRDLHHVLSCVPRLFTRVLTAAQDTVTQLQREQETTAQRMGPALHAPRGPLGAAGGALGAEQHRTAVRSIYESVVYKLQGSGRSDGGGHALSGVDRHVDRQREAEAHARWVVKQATNVDNLCRMYEGWAPWV